MQARATQSRGYVMRTNLLPCGCLDVLDGVLSPDISMRFSQYPQPLKILRVTCLVLGSTPRQRCGGGVHDNDDAGPG